MERFWSKVDRLSEDECWTWAGARSDGRYGQIRVDGKIVRAHRLSWEMKNGVVPDGIHVDHICHNTLCVNPAHLRLCSRSQNMWNEGKRKNNKSGFKGVSWCPSKGAWMATIGIHGKKKTIGRFPTPELAYQAYCAVASTIHGEFANIG